ncbi:MAG TPA: tetratricopeptide repeat protein [Gemmatimonadales bacterium]|nr:tetratricopeptide repeat protein [Gemmatimonadales bacterium]
MWPASMVHSRLLCRVSGAMVIGLLLGAPSLARAQQDVPRPLLPQKADSSSWEPYFDQGVTRLRREPREAAAYFSWASRLAPDRAGPLYAQWVAYWMANWDRWRDYLEGQRDVLRRPEVLRADSLRYLAFVRNPLVHTGLTVLIYDQLPGRWQADPLTQGWLAYGAADLVTAAARFGQVIARDSVKNLWVRWSRASALVSLGQADGALAEMAALLRQLRQADDAKLVEAYQSKEMVLYAIGRLDAALNRMVQAKEAMRQALVENLAFAPAHYALAQLATARRDAGTAIAELAQAVEIDGDDPVLRYEYGQALLAAGRAADAVTELRLVRQREPWWAPPYFDLGRALEATGAPEEAAEAYAAYLDRAPRDALLLGSARAKVASLRSLGSTSHRQDQ